MKRLICLMLAFSFIKTLGQEKKLTPKAYENYQVAELLADLAKNANQEIIIDKGLLDYSFLSYKISNPDFLTNVSAVLAKVNLPLKYYRDKDLRVHIVAKSKKIDPSELYQKPKNTTGPKQQNFTLSGRLIDLATGESLPFAAVQVLNHTQLATSTNVDGYFTLLNVPSDTLSILCSYIGYKQKIVELSDIEYMQGVQIQLETDNKLLEEVTVEGQKTEVVKANEVVGMIKMTPRNIAKLPNVGERDPFRAFQLMPGVSASNESSSGLYVRGGTPDQTLVLYDGFTVYHVDHLFGFFSAFNYNAIKDIQLYKGGFDAKYGGRISAVAEITGKEGSKKGFNAGADVGLLSTNAFVEVPIGSKISFLAAGRRSWKSPLYTKIFNKFVAERTTTQGTEGPGGGRGPEGGLNQFTSSSTASSYFYDINAKLTFTPNKKDIFSVSLFNGNDNMDNSTSTDFTGFGPFQTNNGGLVNTSTDQSTWGNIGGSFKWSRKFTERFYINTLMSNSSYLSYRDNSRLINLRRPGETTSTPQSLGQIENNTVQDLTAKVDLTYKLSSKNQIEFGGQFAKNTVNYDYTQNDTISVLTRNDAGTLSSAYIQNVFNNGKLMVKPGLRVTQFSTTGKAYLEPRLSSTFNINKKVKLKMAAGVYHQFIKQVNREDLSQGNRNFWILANADSLPVTRSEHLIFGAAYEGKKTLLDVEFYVKNNTGITEYSLRFVPTVRQGLKANETFFNGAELIRGVDILLQRKFGAVTGWLGYTLADAVRDIPTFSDKKFYSDQDVRHQFKSVAMYNVKKWDLAATWIYSTGRPYTSIIGAYQLKLLDGTLRNFTNPSDKNANRFVPYHRLDLSAAYNFTNKFSMSISAFNAYNRTNTWYKRFQIITEQGVSLLQTTDINYLGITPNLTFSWKLK